MNIIFLLIDDCQLCKHLYEEVCHNPDHPYNFTVGKEIRYENKYGRMIFHIPEKCSLKTNVG